MLSVSWIVHLQLDLYSIPAECVYVDQENPLAVLYMTEVEMVAFDSLRSMLSQGWFV